MNYIKITKENTDKEHICCAVSGKQSLAKKVSAFYLPRKKRDFLYDPKHLTYKGFSVADTSDCGITMMYLPLADDAKLPKFKECAKQRRFFYDLYRKEAIY